MQEMQVAGQLGSAGGKGPLLSCEWSQGSNSVCVLATPWAPNRLRGTQIEAGRGPFDGPR